MSRFTRRQVLQMLSMILPASALGFRSEGKQDAFDKELVCVHIFQPGFKIPDPLWERYDAIPLRGNPPDLFNLKIPELLLCSSDNRFLSLFDYFWPIWRTFWNYRFDPMRVVLDGEEILRA